MITIKEDQCLRDIDPEADKELMESRGGCLCFLSLSCGGLINRLIVDAVGIEVEVPEDLYGRTCV